MKKEKLVSVGNVPCKLYPSGYASSLRDLKAQNRSAASLTTTNRVYVFIAFVFREQFVGKFESNTVMSEHTHTHTHTHSLSLSLC
jgi:hypothetical protein